MLNLRLLGAPSIADDTGEIYLPSQKAQALLYYLAAEYERSHARGQVIAMLWPESTEREGRNSLSTVLSRMRHALPDLPLRAAGDTLAWRAGAQVDLHTFQATLRTPRGTALAGASTTDAAGLLQLETAVALYRGPFLDGFGLRDSETYDEWLRLERERWQLRWLNAVEQLIDAYSSAGRPAPAIEYARRALAIDPLQERFHRALMRLHYHTGDRAAALAQFRICRETLDRELGVEPDAETGALHQAILDGRLERPTPPVPAPGPPPAAHRSHRLAARLESARRRSFVGRDDELALFSGVLGSVSPPYAVLYIYGPGGVGKSTLLAEYARQCAETGVPSFSLDGRNLQPTPDGVIEALAEVTGSRDPLAALPDRCVLLIDTFELLTPVESWLRDRLLPQMPDQALVVLAGRNGPSSGWRVDPAWQEMTHIVQLGNLSEAEAADYLARRSVPTDQHAAVLRFTRGYPLALSLAAEVLLQRPGSSFDSAASPDIVRELVERFAAGVPSVAHRAALEACAEVRVLSEPLLAAMLEATEARELFAWLRDLSFLSAGPHGIFPHDLAREALMTDLRWRNPPWHVELHHRARRHYLAGFEQKNEHAQHQVLLDLVFLHDHPLLRAIFDWSQIGGVLEDTPRATDWPTLVDMVRRHEGNTSAEIARGWFERQPEHVTVFRDSDGEVSGFLGIVLLRPDCADLIAADPCATTAQQYLAAQITPSEGQIALLRFWMERDQYQGVTPTQGMIFVASARFVLTMPKLGYSFHVFANPDLWSAALEHVLIRREPAADFAVDDRRYGVFVHDWVAQPPRAWLDELANREIAGA
jgi:DNA-binding SARP family transcriptional activator